MQSTMLKASSSTGVGCSQRPRAALVGGHQTRQAPVLHARMASVVAQAKLGDTSMFGASTSSLLTGGKLGDAAAEVPTSSKLPSLDEVDITSTAGIDYTPLRDALKEGDFKKADDVHRALLIKLAGEGAIKRGWVYFSEARTFPVQDLLVFDNLWKSSSNGKFGFSVQRELYNQQGKQWPKFFKKIDWTTKTEKDSVVYRKWPGEFTYTLEAPKGHLPLTNALRGTQLFMALLEHPAFEKSAGKKGIDAKTQEATAAAKKLF
ncbi:hypothetical protein FOA52_013081 [Chlamydomonas sp. UWO 241]|nr:hypothetical protein FOA52_013081 [Chlamydomonas sp. UWO 241]QCS40638.1 chloroplast tetrapyrrole binding protein GUN4 isoform A [Chlamydomonas sp. UWO 241]